MYFKYPVRLNNVVLSKYIIKHMKINIGISKHLRLSATWSLEIRNRPN